MTVATNAPVPYALLHVHGAPVALTREQFEQAARATASYVAAMLA